MSLLPVRFLLLYDPVFLALDRLLRVGEYGFLREAAFHAVCRSFDDIRETLAALHVLFGEPDRHEFSRDDRASLFRGALFYDDRRVSLTVVLSPVAAERVTFNGSIATVSAVMDVRCGAERLLVCSVGNGPPFRTALPEGDAAHYRALDEKMSGGPVAVTPARDKAALSFSAALIALSPFQELRP